MMFRFLLLVATMLGGLWAMAQTIAVNQLGFYPSSYKVAVVPSSVSDASFTLVDAVSNQTVFTGSLGKAALWKPAGSSVRLADFSAFTKLGSYYVKAGAEKSYPFDISENVFEDPTQGLIRAFYYWRSSTAIVPPYSVHKGTDYARAAGHLDNAVEVAAEAASAGRAAGTKFSCAKGWYDAGDYGKYVVSGSVAAYFLLSAFENNQAYLSQLALNIPESSNSIPDILDEAKWETDWFLDNIDPYDGGVYNRVTTGWFAGMNDMPAADGGQRYAYKKSTPSNLDHAALLAVAYRVFKPFEAQLPGYADKCLASALKAWKWARKNPNIAGNGSGGTGQYDDTGFNDELSWAANELYLATKADSFYVAARFLDSSFVVLEEPSWQKTSCLGLMSLATHLDELTPVANKDAIRHKFLHFADSLCLYWDSSAFKVMTNRYWWGINSVVGAQGVIFMNAYKLTNSKRFLNAAVSQYDYLFGRNPLNQSYVTWYGDKSPLHPHDRRSNGDGVTLPQPGYVVGGANSNCSCTGAGPAMQYHDDEGDYAVNEVAVNYSGPAAALAAYLASAFKYTGAGFVSAVCNEPQTISLTLSAAINPSTLKSTGFTLSVNGVVRSVASATMDAASNKRINLSLTQSLLPTDVLLLSLSDTTILATDGFKLALFTNQTVQNNLPGAPLKLQTATLSADGKKLILAFDKNLLATLPAAPSGFSVLANGYSIAVTALARGTDKKTIELTLARPIVALEEVNVLFDGKSVVTAEDTGILLAFGAVVVKNNINSAVVKAKGFRDDYNNNTLGSYLSPLGLLKISEAGEYMTVACNGQGGYDHLIGTVPAMDLTANPKFTMRFKATKSFTLRVDLASVNNGTRVFTNSGTSTKQINITGSADFQTISFTYTDWSGQYPVGTVDKTNVTIFSLMFNPGGGFSDNVIIDYIAIGDAPLSSESHLASLAATGYSLSPAFDSSIYAYTVTLPATATATAAPAITASALDAKASLVLTQATSVTGTATAIATAEDGSKRKYSVQFVLEQPKAKQTISLKQGWNLVSFYVDAPSMSIADVFASALPSIVCIKNNTAYYRANNAPVFNTLTKVSTSEAYLIYSSAAVEVSIAGDYAKPAATNLAAGWNLLGCPVPAEKAISALPSSFAVIKNMDSFYEKGNAASQLTSLKPGEAYFVKTAVSASVVW